MLLYICSCEDCKTINPVSYGHNLTYYARHVSEASRLIQNTLGQNPNEIDSALADANPRVLHIAALLLKSDCNQLKNSNRAVDNALADMEYLLAKVTTKSREKGGY